MTDTGATHVEHYYYLIRVHTVHVPAFNIQDSSTQEPTLETTGPYVPTPSEMDPWT
jgi:hypothetical protein